jgi:hypothetical protein
LRPTSASAREHNLLTFVFVQWTCTFGDASHPSPGARYLRDTRPHSGSHTIHYSGWGGSK